MEHKKRQWMLPRHRWATEILRPIIGTYTRWKYNIKVERFKEQRKRAYLILMNHQTAFDQFFVAMAFRGPVYYVATDDLFSNGWVSSVIRWLVAPIPIKKQATDPAAVMNCLRIARDGGTIALAPEGNRTYSGETAYINPAIAGMARKMKLPIALFRIEGGYGIQPRWSDVVRKGKMRAYVSRVIEPEEYAAMTTEELVKEIEQGLYVNEGVADAIFRSAKRAEYLERAMYVCPFCGLSEFESHGHRVICKGCGKVVEYGEDKRLTGVDCRFPHEFVTQWYAYQENFINNLNLLEYTKTPVYRDRARFSEVILNKRKELLQKDASIALYGDRMVVGEGSDHAQVFPFDEILAASVLGRNKLNIYHGKAVYQFKGSKRFNALKYVNFYHRYKNIIRGEANAKFLGL